MSDKLKPCPFCGNEAELVRMGNIRQSMQIQCLECGCFLESSETELGSDCRWNTRAQPESVTNAGDVEKSDGKCQEEDGCPTEKSVLQRFWREHHNRTATAEADLAKAREVIADTFGALEELLEKVKASKKLAGREFVPTGIRVNAALQSARYYMEGK